MNPWCPARFVLKLRGRSNGVAQSPCDRSKRGIASIARKEGRCLPGSRRLHPCWAMPKGSTCGKYSSGLRWLLEEPPRGSGRRRVPPGVIRCRRRRLFGQPGRTQHRIVRGTRRLSPMSTRIAGASSSGRVSLSNGHPYGPRSFPGGTTARLEARAGMSTTGSRAHPKSRPSNWRAGVRLARGPFLPVRSIGGIRGRMNSAAFLEVLKVLRWCLGRHRTRAWQRDRKAGARRCKRTGRAPRGLPGPSCFNAPRSVIPRRPITVQPARGMESIDAHPCRALPGEIDAGLAAVAW